MTSCYTKSTKESQKQAKLSQYFYTKKVKNISKCVDKVNTLYNLNRSMEHRMDTKTF